MDWFSRIPSAVKTISTIAGVFIAGAAAGQVVTTQRDLPEQLKRTDARLSARIDTIDSRIEAVSSEQDRQRPWIAETTRRLRYLTCTTRPGANDARCVSRHLLDSDLDGSGDR